MTDFEAYQEYIQRKHNAFCKAVIRYAARDKILQLRRKWERQISLDYLMDEKFVQFAGPEPDEEYPFTVCGQTVLLCNAALAAALSAQPKQTQEVILRYYFLRQPQRVIGAHIGRTRSTAGRHIQLALRRLREEMEVCRYEYANGTFEGGKTEAFSMNRTGGAGFEFDTTGKVTYKDGVKEAVEESKEKIMSGEIVPESVREKDK